jgi:hypothetical protein
VRFVEGQAAEQEAEQRVFREFLEIRLLGARVPIVSGLFEEFHEVAHGALSRRCESAERKDEADRTYRRHDEDHGRGNLREDLLEKACRLLAAQVGEDLEASLPQEGVAGVYPLGDEARVAHHDVNGPGDLRLRLGCGGLAVRKARAGAVVSPRACALTENSEVLFLLQLVRSAGFQIREEAKQGDRLAETDVVQDEGADAFLVEVDLRESEDRDDLNPLQLHGNQLADFSGALPLHVPGVQHPVGVSLLGHTRKVIGAGAEEPDPRLVEAEVLQVRRSRHPVVAHADRLRDEP